MPLHDYQYEWPNGARIAVVLQLPFETWSDEQELSILPRIPLNERPPSGGELNESGILYAVNVGLRRLADLVDRYELPATVVANGSMAEKFPETLNAIVNGRIPREVCAHSWTQDDRSYRFTKEAFRDNVRRCTEALQSATGQRPVGWVSPAGLFAQHNVEVLAEEGFLYHGDYADTDSGRVIEVSGRRLVAQPVPWEVNDAEQYAFAFNPPSAYVEIFHRAFDVLYREGGQVLGAVAHASIYGRPWGTSAYQDIIRYALDHPAVWFATRRQIAEIILEQR